MAPEIKVHKQNFISFWVIIFNFTPLPWQPEKKNFFWKNKKNKKIPGDIIILHLCTKSNNYYDAGSWNMEYDRQVSVILDFLPFEPPNNTWKIKSLNKWKKRLEIYICSFYTCVP